jgi:hypothetical protein
MKKGKNCGKQKQFLVEAIETALNQRHTYKLTLNHELNVVDLFDLERKKCMHR